MLWEAEFDPSHPERAIADLIKAWDGEDRVFVLRAGGAINDPTGFYDRYLGALGTPCALAEDVTVGDRSNQRTGSIWMEVRYDPNHPDAYRHSRNAQPLHTDGSYISSFPNATLMYCVASAGIGGETTFIDAQDVVDALRAADPALLDYLTSQPILHSRSGDQRLEKVIDLDGDLPLVNWNYYCLADDLTADDRAAGEAFFQFLQSDPAIAARTMAVKLLPGDAITWKDRRLLHGRNGFEPKMTSERFLMKCAIDIGQFAVAA
jgi:alpha-ketoglutarate-dependent taurine dioxygenase